MSELTEDRVREIVREEFGLVPVAGGECESADAEPVEPPPTGAVINLLAAEIDDRLTALREALSPEVLSLIEKGWYHYIGLYIIRTGSCTADQRLRAFGIAYAQGRRLGLWGDDDAGLHVWAGIANVLAGDCLAPPNMVRADEWRHVDKVEGDPSKQPSHR